jgi:LEA14-like dessication related protein
LDGRHIGQFSIDTLVSIPGNSNFTLPVKLQVDMKKVLKNSLTALFNNEITVKVAGTAKLGKGGLYIRYPIKYEGKQNLDKLLRQNDSLNQHKLR